MRKFLPIVMVFILLIVISIIVVSKKKIDFYSEKLENNIGTFKRQQQCARPPQFLAKLKIPQPVVIDLSQKRFKGIALLYGKEFEQVLHPKQWEQYAYFSTYTVDKKGNIYLVPTPFISIYPSTFNLQKNIYKLDSKLGKISIFMHLEDVVPSASNPYGINAIVYDCDDETLWVAAIDESNYEKQKGVIYHIDIHTKKILQRIEGFDLLSMYIVKSIQGKFLLAGSARNNVLYAFQIRSGKLQNKPQKILELPHANEYIRKIKLIDDNTLELQTIAFSYALIAQSSKQDRLFYHARWYPKNKIWKIIQNKSKKLIMN